MAGGPHAQVVACLHCLGRAERTHQGLEDDLYLCAAGHTFGIDWSVDGPPGAPRWPPSAEEAAQFEWLRQLRGPPRPPGS